MALPDSSKSLAENTSPSAGRPAAGASTSVIPAGVSPSGPAEYSGSQLLSIPIGAFYNQLPQELLTAKKPDLARLVHIDSEDVVLDDTIKQASILLSILSLSCPEIFSHPVNSNEDVEISFPLESRDIDSGSGAHLSVSGAGPGVEEAWETSAAATPVQGPPGNEDADGRDEIRVRLGPILAALPPEIELLPTPAPYDPQTEIVLPLKLVTSQLKDGKVTITGTFLRAALPAELKNFFEELEPIGEISVPLREVFRRLSPEAIKLREDYELGYSLEAIPTPFAAQTEEDTIRDRTGSAGMALSGPERKSVPQITLEKGSDEAKTTEVKAGLPSATAQPFFPTVFDSPTLQALFMTEEVLDLAKTIQKVSQLPGLRACLLATTDGRKLAGELADSIEAIAMMLPDLWQKISSALGKAQSLEGLTLYLGRDLMSITQVNELCLFVMHDDRPFRPGVREKVFAVTQELDKISRSGKEV